jgi:transposase-like protein
VNLLSVTKTFTTEDAALDYLIKQRWPKGVRCLACDHNKIYKIATKGKSGKPCRLFECADCGLHFSATTGTLFHDSHLPLTKWFMAMALMAEAKKGISANQISRHLGIQYKTAWYLCHRIRKAMEELNAAPLGGQGKTVEIDEAFLGGKKHGKGVKAGVQSKVRLLGIAERNGRVHLQRITDGKAGTLRPIFQSKLDPATDKIVSDGATNFGAIFNPERIDQFKHKDDFAEKGELTAKTVEGAFSLFKRGIIGSYHHLSTDHLDSYLNEFCWRFNRRSMQPWIFQTLLTELVTKKPMTYRYLTREVF